MTPEEVLAAAVEEVKLKRLAYYGRVARAQEAEAERKAAQEVLREKAEAAGVAAHAKEDANVAMHEAVDKLKAMARGFCLTP